MADISEMERLLLRENEILDRMLERQSALRAAVLQKKWDGVLESISAITKLPKLSKKPKRRETRFRLPGATKRKRHRCRF